MNQSQNLTYIPLAKLVNNLPDDVSLQLSADAQAFLAEQFTGAPDLAADDYLHYKDGVPAVVNEWGRGFDLELGLDPEGDYALATILHIAMKWRQKAEAITLQIDRTPYQAANHDNAWRTNIEGLYQIPVKEDGLTFLVSAERINLDMIDESVFQTEEIELSVPLVSMKTEENLSPVFEGTIANVNGEAMICSSVKVLTELEMDLAGAEVKQAATMMLMRGCLGPSKPHIVINKAFYAYVKVKDKLVFAAKIDKDSFHTVK